MGIKHLRPAVGKLVSVIIIHSRWKFSIASAAFLP
jgi:hypothetical protein